MPFIGQEPITGAFHKLDAITTSSTNTYNLLLNGSAFSPASANNLMVSLNGVIQSPGDSFTVSGSQITFVPSSGTLSSSDSIDFIMAYGDVLNIGTPSDGTVTSEKIAVGAVTDAKISGMASSKLTGAMPALDGSALTGIDSITYTTPVSLAGGYNNKTFTGIPSTAKLIRVIWSGVTPGGGYPEWRLGNSSAMIVTGYYNMQFFEPAGSASSSSYLNNGNSFRLNSWTQTNNNWYGWFDFVKNDQTDGNVFWHQTSNIFNAFYDTYAFNITGFVIAGSTNPVDRYYIGRSDGNNFTSGTVQVGYA